MDMLKAGNREPFKRLMLFAARVGAFYGVLLVTPVNYAANKMMGWLLLYVLLNQDYVRRALVFNYQSLWHKKMEFVCNFSMNQATSLAFFLTPLFDVILPQLSGLVTVGPTLCRFTQCFVVGTHEQYLNTIKFTLNLLGFAFLVVEMPGESHFWRVLASAYSFYWDVVTLAPSLVPGLEVVSQVHHPEELQDGFAAGVLCGGAHLRHIRPCHLGIHSDELLRAGVHLGDSQAGVELAEAGERTSVLLQKS